MKLTKIQQNHLLTKVAVASQRAIGSLNNPTSDPAINDSGFYVCPRALRRKIQGRNGAARWANVLKEMRISPTKFFSAVSKQDLISVAMGGAQPRSTKFTKMRLAVSRKYDELLYGPADGEAIIRTAKKAKSPTTLEKKRQSIIDLTLSAQDAIVFNADDARATVETAIKKITNLAK